MGQFKQLTAPITAKEIEWRIQSIKNGYRIVVPYITSRAVMNRLDAAFGPENWQTEFNKWGNTSVKCKISILFIDSQNRSYWVAKEDGADESNIEATKGGFSDSLKRCAVQWGIGRDLYEYPFIRVKGDSKYLEPENITRLNNMADLIAKGEFNKKIVQI